MRLLEKKKHKPDISYMPGAFWNEVIDFTDEQVIQCDVPAVKNDSLNDGDNSDRKWIFMGIQY